MFRSFIKNVKEHKKRSVLLKRTNAQPWYIPQYILYTYIYYNTFPTLTVSTHSLPTIHFIHIHYLQYILHTYITYNTFHKYIYCNRFTTHTFTARQLLKYISYTYISYTYIYYNTFTSKHLLQCISYNTFIEIHLLQYISFTNISFTFIYLQAFTVLQYIYFLHILQ